MPWISGKSAQISTHRLEELMHETARQARQARERLCGRPRRVLLLPPDTTRAHSGVGRLTEVLCRILEDEDGAEVHVIPTLSQHVPHTPEENRRMFGSIPNERIHAHDWRDGCVEVGEIPADYVEGITRGAADWAIPVWLNRPLMEQQWDLETYLEATRQSREENITVFDDAKMQDLAHGTAHLIHGSSEGRFRITYAPGHLSKEEIEGVNFGYADLQQTAAKYPPEKLREGFNEVDGERIFFIPTPSAGLWATREKLYGRAAGFGT